MRKESISKNYFFQLIYQGLILVIPLALAPYLTRTLRETAIGVYSYANSIAFYFVIVANLGISVHGKRVISYNYNNPIKLRQSFWSLFWVHSILSFLAMGMYLCFVCFFIKANIDIFYIEAIYVLSALFDITWLFYGLENFSSIVIKNSIVKVIECIAIFLFVKEPGDLKIYALIIAGGTCLGQMVMIPQAVKLIKPIRVSYEDCKIHLKPLLVFSVALVASSLYTVFNKTLLGIMANKSDVAFYEFSNKIIAVPQTFVGVIGTVMFPRACRLAAEGKLEEQKKYIDISAVVTAFIGMGSIFGLLGVSKLFATLFYGESFSVCGGIIAALSPTVYIVGAGSILRTQCLIPNGMDKQFNLCIVYNAVINLVISTSLIPLIGIYGAVIGTLAAETFGLIYQMILCRKLIDLKRTYGSLFAFALFGLIMYLVIMILNQYVPQSWRGLLILFIVGGTIYCGLTVVYLRIFKTELLKSFINQLIKRR